MDVGERGQRVGQGRGVEVGEPAAVAGRQVAGLGLGRVEVGRERVVGGVEVGEVPADLLGAGQNGGVVGHILAN